MAGVLSVVVCSVGILSVAAGGMRARLLEIQLGNHPDHVHDLILARGRRSAAQRSLRIDYGFIAAYWLTFTELAVLLAHRHGWWIALGLAAAFASTLTAATDVVENIRTSGVLALDAPGSRLTQVQLDELRRASLAKWAAAALTVALLAGLFAQRGWPAGVAVAFLALAAVGAAGLWWRRLIPLFFLGVFAAAAFVAVLFLIWPETVVESLL